ncbi:MAG TPA: GNAT family N-acetyltransferase [Candidatus Limnocylindrales bacterium]|jgi:GNAT superfamily N-acetyltransferase
MRIAAGERDSVPISVRDAEPADSGAIQAVADAAWHDTYRSLLSVATIDAFVAAAYSLDRLGDRIANDVVLVAEEDHDVVAFADAVARADRLTLGAIYARPDRRRNGAGRSLLDELRRRFPDLPIAADVLLGNRAGEGFYDRLGFIPRERIETELFGESVVERRWWLDTRKPA